MEIPKFKKTSEELTSDYDRWLYAFKNLHRLKDHPKELEAGIFKRLIEIAELAKFDPLAQQDYQESLKDYWDLKSSMDTYYEEGKVVGKAEGKAEGKKEGKAEGKAEGKTERDREIVLSGLKQGLDIQLITALTGLSKDTIEQIRDGN